MRTLALVTAIAILGFARQGAVAQQSGAPPAAGGEEQDAVGLFEPGTLSAVFAEEPVDTDWARATEASIAAEIQRQAWPGLTSAEVECRRSICALLLVYSSGGDVESKVKANLRKALGFVGIRSARKALPGSTVSEVVFFR